MDPPDITGDVEPASPLHLPDRNSRRAGGVTYTAVRRQYNYKPLQNEATETSPTHGSVQKVDTRPARPPQPKFMSKESADTGLLIDLQDDSKPVSQDSKSAKSHMSDISLLDSSIAEKYKSLPLPLNEQSAVSDPFEIKLDSVACSVFTTGYNSSSSQSNTAPHFAQPQNVGSISTGAVAANPSPMYRPASSPNPSSSSSSSQSSFSSTSYPQYGNLVVSLPPVSTSVSTAVSTSSTSLYSNEPLYRSSSASAVQWKPSVADSSSSGRQSPQSAASASPIPPRKPIDARPKILSQGQPRSSSPYTSENGSPVPPIPPRIYANVPIGEMEKPLPPEPNKGFNREPNRGSNRSSNRASPQSGYSPSRHTTEKYQNRGQNQVQGSRYYSMPPMENSSPAKQKTNSVNLDQSDLKKKEMDKAFDWLSSAVAEGLNMEKDKNAAANVNKDSDKAALKSWDNKDLVPSKTGPKQCGNSVFYDDVADEGKVKGAEGGVDNMAWSSSEQQSVVQTYYVEHSSPPPPPLPPRGPHLGVPQTSKSRNPYSNIPASTNSSRILPVVQDGEKKSGTHYFLIPDKEQLKQTAEVKPFSVDGQKPKFCDDYHNLGESGVLLNQAVNVPLDYVAEVKPHQLKLAMKERPQEQKQSPSKTSATAAFLSNSENFSLADIGEKSTLNRSWDSTQLSPTFDESSMSDLSERIDRVQMQVHGVTQEECHTALACNKWKVEPAVKYLKLEQLFRLGIASREKCRHLLDTFDWNLEMAGSVLLDELSSGSTV